MFAPGIPVPVPWTHLAQTATNGSLTLTLLKAVTWKPGDEIVIASTGHRYKDLLQIYEYLREVFESFLFLVLSQFLTLLV